MVHPVKYSYDSADSNVGIFKLHLFLTLFNLELKISLLEKLWELQAKLYILLYFLFLFFKMDIN